MDLMKNQGMQKGIYNSVQSSSAIVPQLENIPGVKEFGCSNRILQMSSPASYIQVSTHDVSENQADKIALRLMQ